MGNGRLSILGLHVLSLLAAKEDDGGREAIMVRVRTKRRKESKLFDK